VDPEVTEEAGLTSLDVRVPAALDGQRVDRALSMLSGMSRRSAAEVVAGGGVLVDGRPVRTRSTTLRQGQRLEAMVSQAPSDRPQADPSVGFSVVYADDDLVVVDKPAGLVVHHGAGHRGGTLVDGLLARFADLAELAESGVGDPSRPGIVHRLDKGTSGLMVVARSAAGFEALSAQLRAHRAERRYLALVTGIVPADRGQVDAPIDRSWRHRDRMTVRAGGRPARTGYLVQARYRSPVPATLIEARLETGRTHQVRVHMSAIGHPVVGDQRYGGARALPRPLVERLGSDRLFLHAWRLTVEHPDGRVLSWESPLPADLEDTLSLLELLEPQA